MTTRITAAMHFALALLLWLVGCGGGSDGSCPAFVFPTPSSGGVKLACKAPLAVFQGSISSVAPRDSIEVCKASILDGSGGYLLQDEVMGAEFGPSGLIAGCASGQTRNNVGTFYYMTKQTTGVLTFRIDAYDGAGNQVQTGSGQAEAVIYPPPVPVIITMRAP
jgi:hypothetical protein